MSIILHLDFILLRKPAFLGFQGSLFIPDDNPLETLKKATKNYNPLYVVRFGN